MFRVFPTMTLNRQRGEVGGGSGAPHPRVARPGGARVAKGCGLRVSLLHLPFRLRVRVGKIGTLAFFSSNSENIS